MADAPGPGRARSVRHRLLAIALLPTLVILPLLLGVAVARWSGKFEQLLITKVGSDLTVARQYLARIIETTGERVAALGQSAEFVASDDLAALLDRRRAGLGLDFLYLADAEGRVLAASPPGAHPSPQDALRAEALAGRGRSGIDVFPAAALAAISPGLAERARIPLVATRNAAPTDRAFEDRGMVVQTAAPVILPDGAAATLVGGVLLNQNLAFIDAINDLVYGKGGLPEGSAGTATLFLDDVRISTNVRLFEGQRALGTRVSAEVRDQVLSRGEAWLDRAFVVDDWYVSAYEPILDSSGARVGMLYVGFLEAPFAAARRTTLLLIVGAFVAVAAVSVPLFLRWAGGIFRPLEQVSTTIAAVESGDLGARTGVVRGADEIGRVAVHLDGLLDQIEERDQALRTGNEALAARVEERTADLRRANLELEATSRQLILSEKLAAVGEITASVAHEINNPVAVIQGNLDLLREILGENAAAAETEFRLLDEQVHRISVIVGRLLQFARPEEYAGWAERTDPRQVVADCLPLVRHLLSSGRVELRQDCRSTRQLLMNRIELQQVLINLIVNAIHAMPEGGVVAIETGDADLDGAPGVRIVVRDTGVGMDAATLARVFEPFFSTRGASGTGLGLAICRRLVDRQGGRIDARSEPGAGTTFTIWLPEAA